FVAIRMAMNAAVFFVAMWLFGALHSGTAPLAVLAAVLTALAAATAAYAFTAWVSSETRFVLLYRLGVLPVTFFSGVFFAIEQLPLAVRPLAWFSPLWHGVELCRAATLGTASALPWPLHVASLMVWVVAGYPVARR